MAHDSEKQNLATRNVPCSPTVSKRHAHAFCSVFYALVLVACSTPPQKYSPDDLLIPPDHIVEKAPEKLTQDQVATDVSYLKYALDRGYAGRDFLPSGAFQQMMTRISTVSGPMTPQSLRDRIDEILTEVPDNHLSARLDGKRSDYRKSKTPTGSVGNNFYEKNMDKPWAVEIRKIHKKPVLFISITALPFYESSVWKGFLEQVESKLPKVKAAVIDMRGNDGGDDTTGFELAWIFYGKNFRQGEETQFQRVTPETQALYANMFAYQLERNLEQHKQPEDFLIRNYRSRLDTLALAKTKNTDGYTEKAEGDFQSGRKHSGTAEQFAHPILILTDRRCASSCESTISAFEFHPQVKRIGENTGGYIHFGDVSPMLLPNSKVVVQMGTHYDKFYDNRFIEKTGIRPDIAVPPGTDALSTATEYLKDH